MPDGRRRRSAASTDGRYGAAQRGGASLSIVSRLERGRGRADLGSGGVPMRAGKICFVYTAIFRCQNRLFLCWLGVREIAGQPVPFA
jgi:hypothetical protein